MAAYVALYRKYRPRSFAELVGQEAIAKTLASAIMQQRLAHAYLFCGPRGTGKTSVARILAKSVNCQQGPTDFPCGTCSTCLEITNGTNLDVVEIDAASNNGVDNIRDLQDRVALAPVGGRFKVYIIDEVHMLSQGAFNALLKTLEEPPPNVIFVLATTDPHKVLPTIISRCQRFDFGRIPLGPLVGRLEYVAGQEGIPVDRAGLEAIARRAHGGLRDALSLLDQTAAMAAGAAISAEEVAASLGLLSSERLCALGQALLDGDAALALEIAHDLVAAGHEHSTVIRELLGHFRHLLVLQLAPDRADVLDVPTVSLETLTRQAAQAQGAELTWLLEALNETEGVLRRSPQQAIWLELGLIKVARRPAIPSLMELAERVSALEAAVGQGGRPLPAPVPMPRAVPTPARPQTPPPIPHPPDPDPAASFSAPAAEIDAPRASAADPAIEANALADLPPRPPLADLPPRPPLADLPPRPPVADPRPRTAAVEPPAAAPLPPVADGVHRPLPLGAWDRVRESVRVRSRPTGALLDPPTTVDRWESDGAVVIRIPKALKDIFERQPAKKKVLSEEIAKIFGQGAFPRLEASEGKAPGRSSTPAPAAPAARPPAEPTPRPTAPPPGFGMSTMAAPSAPSAPPAAPVDDEPPFDDQPPAWLDDYESSRPPEHDPAVAPATHRALAAQPAPTEGDPEDSALKLAVDLFNGRVIRRTEPPRTGDTPA